MKRAFSAFVGVLMLFTMGACTKSCKKEPPAPAGKVFFIEPADKAEVTSPFVAKFGVEGMKVAPAGENMEAKDVGHHHLIIDGTPIEKGQVIPTDEKHIHYGKGETEATVHLAPGEHTLTLQFGDPAHKSLGPNMSTTIKVMVKPPVEAVPAPTGGDAAPGAPAADGGQKDGEGDAFPDENP